ncbi:transcriptional regulator, Crp/Fnr family [Arcobacter venerupis]|uniref:Transcriptional regulator, Crp/Fnr family n=1 Tax=Arcobacter venerupis TaxID=1054033 RepID=A0AAE7B9A1_9BACT|nr:Crp/Fnr family transcriptional regulator [Arcobacter venerupis]QKF66087.1 transcriptional regulator, Crp/Fnr family [Arcobacter venerupis]RWS51124.1 transcriptional regulator [Arcobacter venerupis]
MTLQDTIRKISFFNTLNDEQIELIASISNVSKYSSNSILYYESEVSKNLLFLVEGLIKVYKLDKFDNEIFLYHIYKNSMISELTSMNNNDIYCFSNTEFIEDSIMLSIDFEKFKELFLSKNILTMELLEILLTKTHQLQCIVNRELVFDATAKVAFMLNQDLEMFNKLKRQEVSFMLHIQPETLSRVLKRLTRDGTIHIENSEVSITNKENLISIFKGIGV